MKKKVSIFGSTGSIGKKTVALIAKNPELYCVEILTAHSNIQLLAEQAKLLKAKNIVISNPNLYKDLKNLLTTTNVNIYCGYENIVAAASQKVDWAMMSIIGIAALEPLIALINAKTPIIALANKESIVCGGNILLELAKQQQVQIIPVDSEHNAIFQIFNQKNYIEKIILTASGGPFLNTAIEKLKTVDIELVVSHPIWNMGKKISVDSATMMNKTLEIIEAYHLFSLNHDKIDVLIHPESIIHGIVSYIDGSNLSVMSYPEISIPIAYALAWPERIHVDNTTLDLLNKGALTFYPPNYNKFPALKLAKEILKSKNIHTNSIILNAANEIAVDEFLNSKINFTEIVYIVENMLSCINFDQINSTNDIIACDRYSRSLTREYIAKFLTKKVN